jgi:pimeloyl-ACP methyl ester carboxylesterase
VRSDPAARARPSRPPLRTLLLRRLKALGVLLLALALGAGGMYLIAPGLVLRGDYAVQAWQAHLHTRTLQVGATRWVYYEGGKGPTLMLLHGFGGSRENWLPTARYLGRNFHLIIPDLPGYGASSPIAGSDAGIHAQARRLAGFVEALKLKHFALAGHSMGGAIAGVYAAEHPDRVAALALLDSAGLPFRTNAFARDVAAGHNPFAYRNRAQFARFMRLIFAKPPYVPPRIADVLIARNVAAQPFLDATLARLRAPDDADALVPVLPRLTMPVLGLWCNDDRVIDPSALDALRKGLAATPQIGTSLLNGCDHMPIMEEPRATADALTRFLTGAP